MVLTNGDSNTGHYAIADAVDIAPSVTAVDTKTSTVAGTPPATAPTDLTATTVASTSVTIDWTDIGGYDVQRSADGGSTWTAPGGVILTPSQD